MPPLYLLYGGDTVCFCLHHHIQDHNVGLMAVRKPCCLLHCPKCCDQFIVQSRPYKHLHKGTGNILINSDNNTGLFIHTASPGLYLRPAGIQKAQSAQNNEHTAPEISVYKDSPKKQDRINLACCLLKKAILCAIACQLLFLHIFALFYFSGFIKIRHINLINRQK